MSKHTPGPWDWRNIDDLRQAKSTRTDGRYGESVLYASYDYDRGPYLETTDANRALIAAAPDLLAALTQLVCCVSHMNEHPAMVNAYDVIKKARALAAWDAVPGDNKETT